MRTPWIYPWRGSYNDKLEISKKIKDHISGDAVFLTPPDFTHLKTFGERSSYVDYKAMIHHPNVMSHWYERIMQVYNFESDANSSLQRLSSSESAIRVDETYLDHLRQLGVTHVLLNKSAPRINPELVHGGYFVYTLNGKDE